MLRVKGRKTRRFSTRRRGNNMKTKRVVLIEVLGGVAYVVDKPSDIDVVIHDRDNDVSE